jgi:hypothetical protein
MRRHKGDFAHAGKGRGMGSRSLPSYGSFLVLFFKKEQKRKRFFLKKKQKRPIVRG